MPCALVIWCGHVAEHSRLGSLYPAVEYRLALPQTSYDPDSPSASTFRAPCRNTVPSPPALTLRLFKPFQ